jgi:glycyl-radical enzyme activating protein
MTSALYNPGPKGFIFDIQGLSVHDGPGCRTLIFLSGCSLECSWCSNPEGIGRKPSLMFFPKKCIYCGNCVDTCPHNAIRIENDVLEISRELCASCERPSCLDGCYTDALKIAGHEVTVPEMMEIIRRDRQYWGPGGGITLTGGEPLLQIDFAEEILAKCHESYIHTAIETCGNVPWKNLQKIMAVTDWIFFDLKNMDNGMHKNATGIENSLILDNAKRLSAEFPGRLMFRLPLIPGFNDSPENISSLITFIKETGRNEINILPLHHLGREKYALLGKTYSGGSFPTPENNQLNDLKIAFIESCIYCYIGSETPF